ncbi:hypothetical protein ACH5RR_029760 [Cinchona calisaya]|uniref:Uncharacterized protein n=1 Tax=Cinchona calisaya TaxID=153742 RepID=A0ABD2YSL4_9GENT
MSRPVPTFAIFGIGSQFISKPAVAFAGSRVGSQIIFERTVASASSRVGSWIISELEVPSVSSRIGSQSIFEPAVASEVIAALADAAAPVPEPVIISAISGEFPAAAEALNPVTYCSWSVIFDVSLDIAKKLVLLLKL